MDFSKFTFCFFPTLMKMSVAFISFFRGKHGRSIYLPKEIMDILKQDAKQMRIKDKEVIPFLFSKEIYEGLKKDRDFFNDLDFLIQRNQTTFWFFGDKQSLQNLAIFLQNKFPDTENYFHKQTPEDKFCQIWLEHQKVTWRVEEINPEKLVSYN